MARAGFCTKCNSNVWLTAEGTCPSGHTSSDIRNVYETEAETQRREQFHQIAQQAPAFAPSGTIPALAPCPSCGSRNGQKVSYTWWGGLLGPKLFNHTKCLGCGAKYNGKTGKSNTIPVAIYVGVTSVIAFVVVFWLTSQV